jgi:DNA-binding Lrp family transcriptional regulator
MHINGLDEIDNQIVNLLIEDARLTYSEIGEKVGLSRVAVKNRVSTLEERGIIKGYHADVDPLEAPKMMTFVAVIKTRADSYDLISDALEQEACVVTLCKMSGDNILHAICVADSMAEMNNFAWRVRNKYEGLLSFSAQMVWEIKKGSVLPK